TWQLLLPLQPSQCHALHRRCHCGAHEAIQPVIVAAVGTQPPLVYLTAASFRSHPVFTDQVSREQPVRFWLPAKQSDRAGIAYRHCKSLSHEALPPIRVEGNVTDGAVTRCGHAPVQSDPLALTARVLRERCACSSNVSPMTRRQDRRVC